MSKRLCVMLDCSRNAVMKVEKLKEFILILKKMGYNSFMMYTEDTYEIEGEPYFGYLRGRYSIKELKEIDSFCNENSMELIPCIQTLAHLNQALKYWFYANIKDINDILLIDEERTYALIEKMFITLSKAFTSRRVHIGMDEAHLVGLGNYLKKHGYKNRFELIKKHLEKVIKIAEKHGFEPIIWSDMFFRLANGGEYYIDDPIFTEEAKASIPENVALCYWDYYHNDKDYYAKMIRAHKSSGREVWFAGGAWKWVGFCSGNQKTLDTMIPAISACKEEDVDNIIITMWGDDGNECQAYSLLPALMCVAETYKGNNDIEDIKRKFINGSKPMLYSDPFSGLLDIFVSGGEGAAYKKLADDLSLFEAKKGKFGSLFESAESLARILSVKYELGSKTRKYYKQGEIVKLQKLLSDYNKAVKYIDVFIEKFEILWLEMNKPNGFEVQQIRLGGLKERLNGCRKRLKAYMEGKIKVIEELEEDLVDEGKKMLPYLHQYSEIVTVNII